ncbi:torsin-1A-interacting protein 2-like isoform X1 [Clupea harengus]|uniref:Torsin-1A-interacting protein 2-like isoform X1 n=1 Tax=Clupea harengus TaxID=7950 RepID=A0A6P3W7T8_CLUHA|nr:torsin-1A-interacting protein 2-like isoform X1 [Clupea harengus]
MDVSHEDKEMPEGNRLNEKVSEEGDRSSEEKEEDHLSRNKDEVGGGDSALADKGALGGDEGHKAGCEGDAATPGTVQSNETAGAESALLSETTEELITGAPGEGATEAPAVSQPDAEGDIGAATAVTPQMEEKDVQSTTDEGISSGDASDKPAADTLTVAGPAAGGDIDAATDAIKTQEGRDGKRTSNEDLTKETTDEEMTVAPGKGATEATVVSQPDAEGATGGATAVTQQMEEKDVRGTTDEGISSGDASDKPAADTLTVAGPAAGGDIDAATDAIKTQEGRDGKRTSNEDLTKETTDEEMTVAPGKGATEATVVSQPDAEGATGGATAVTQQMEEKDVRGTTDEGISSGDASGKPTTETLTVEAAAATAGSDIGGLEREIPETEEQAPDQQRRTEEERIDPIPPSATTSNLHFPVVLVIGAVSFLVLALLVVQWQPTAEPKRPNLDRLEVLREELAKVEQSFRSQRPEVWRRSRIHLQRHLKSAPPSEPVSLILVGGYRAEKTLGCLAERLAKAFSLALNGSVLQVDGASLANMDHDQVKLDLDNQLREAFEGDKQAAVIHRLEELPPSSSLIFYRYCDHENAAFKHPLLAFTVLLPQDAVGPEFSISQVEELVHSHIHKKFLTSDQPDTFDRMDVDKLSGLWSRISHLILPVNMEEHMERGGC